MHYIEASEIWCICQFFFPIQMLSLSLYKVCLSCLLELHPYSTFKVLSQRLSHQLPSVTWLLQSLTFLYIISSLSVFSHCIQGCHFLNSWAACFPLSHSLAAPRLAFNFYVFSTPCSDERVNQYLKYCIFRTSKLYLFPLDLSSVKWKASIIKLAAWQDSPFFCLYGSALNRL